MFKYVGSEFGSDKDDYQLIIEGYERAQKKGYIRSNNTNNSSLSNSQSFSGGSNTMGTFRGRGGYI